MIIIPILGSWRIVVLHEKLQATTSYRNFTCEMSIKHHMYISQYPLSIAPKLIVMIGHGVFTCFEH